MIRVSTVPGGKRERLQQTFIFLQYLLISYRTQFGSPLFISIDDMFSNENNSRDGLCGFPLWRGRPRMIHGLHHRCLLLPQAVRLLYSPVGIRMRMLK